MLLFSLFCRDLSPHGLGVLATELKNMPHLNPASFFKALFWAMDTVIACFGIAKIHRWNGAEIRPAAPPAVLVACVGSTDKSFQLGSCCVGEFVKRLLPAARPREGLIRQIRTD